MPLDGCNAKSVRKPYRASSHGRTASASSHQVSEGVRDDRIGMMGRGEGKSEVPPGRTASASSHQVSEGVRDDRIGMMGKGEGKNI